MKENKAYQPNTPQRDPCELLKSLLDHPPQKHANSSKDYSRFMEKVVQANDACRDSKSHSKTSTFKL